MPQINQGGNATLTLLAGDIVTVVANGGEFKVEFPTGTLIDAGGADKTYGPYSSGGSFKITANQGNVWYEQASLAFAPAGFVISPAAPINADGRPDGTVYIQTA